MRMPSGNYEPCQAINETYLTEPINASSKLVLASFTLLTVPPTVRVAMLSEI